MAIKIYLANKFPDYQGYARYALWAIATTTLLGSLALSEVFNLVPCTLCWWQRTFMFPIAFISTVGVLRKDQNVSYYVLPLAIIGGIISTYHSLLQWGIIKETVLDCTLNGAVSCAKPEIMWFGFISIPFMALCSFATLAMLAWLALPTSTKK